MGAYRAHFAKPVKCGAWRIAPSALFPGERPGMSAEGSGPRSRARQRHVARGQLLRESTSRTMVTGPSFTSSTSIRAPKTARSPTHRSARWRCSAATSRPRSPSDDQPDSERIDPIVSYPASPPTHSVVHASPVPQPSAGKGAPLGQVGPMRARLRERLGPPPTGLSRSFPGGRRHSDPRTGISLSTFGWAAKESDGADS